MQRGVFVIGAKKRATRRFPNTSETQGQASTKDIKWAKKPENTWKYMISDVPMRRHKAASASGNPGWNRILYYVADFKSGKGDAPFLREDRQKVNSPF